MACRMADAGSGAGNVETPHFCGGFYPASDGSDLPAGQIPAQPTQSVLGLAAAWREYPVAYLRSAVPGGNPDDAVPGTRNVFPGQDDP